MRLYSVKCMSAFALCIIIVYFLANSITPNVEEYELPAPDLRISYEDHYILNASSCNENHKYVMIITSYVEHVELRSAHRRAMPPGFLEKLGIKRVFLIAKIPKSHEISIKQNAIIDEHQRYGDLLQGDFYEAYRNLTLKHIMGLNWSTNYCSLTDVIIKLDDDIAFNIDRILKYINYKFIANNQSLAGYVMRGMKPIRLKANKWYVSMREYSKSYYPPFLSGWMYLITPRAARSIVDTASFTPHFWIDDVFVTGMLASKANVKLTDFKLDNMFLEYYELLDCCLNDMVKKNIMCEYAIGPNGNDNNMIIKFNNAINKCTLYKCKPRPMGKSLNDTCISIKNKNPHNNGNPMIDIYKL